MILYYQLKKKGKKWKKYCKEVTRYMDSTRLHKDGRIYKELEEALQLKRINEELIGISWSTIKMVMPLF